MTRQRNRLTDSPTTASTRHRTTRELGAAVVEAALITPLFILLVFGIIETGSYLFDQSRVQTTARDGAREGSASAADAVADRNLLLIARRSLGSLTRHIDGVIVFKAEAHQDTAPSACMAELENGGRGVAGVCNIYRESDLNTPDIANFGSEPTENCVTALTWDRCWPPLSRNDVLGKDTTPDLIGVYVQARHKSITGILPVSSVNATVVVPIEAQRSVDQ